MRMCALGAAAFAAHGIPSNGRSFYGGGRKRLTAASRMRQRATGLENAVNTTPFHYRPGDMLDTPRRPNVGGSRHVNGMISPNNLFEEDFSGSDLEDREEPTITRAGPLAGSSSFNMSHPVPALTPNMTPSLPHQSTLPRIEFHSMLQQQQTMLLKVMQQQETIIEQQGQLKGRLDDMEHTVANLSSDMVQRKLEQQKKPRLASDLTVSIITI